MDYEIIRISLHNDGDGLVTAQGRFVVREMTNINKEATVLDFELEISVNEGTSYAEVEKRLHERFTEFGKGISQAVPR